jgi:hypothetical protein
VATGPNPDSELGGLDPDLLINDCEFGWASLVAFLDSLHVQVAVKKFETDEFDSLLLNELNRKMNFCAALL